MTENIKTTPDTKDFDEHVDQALELATNQSARRLLSAPEEQLALPEKTRSRADYKIIGKKILAATGIAAAGWFGVSTINTMIGDSEVTVSDEREDYTVQDGDGLWTVADQVDNIEKVDPRLVIDEIRNHPANQEALEDGLQPGDIISYPSSVK